MSGIFTLVGALTIIILSIKVFYDIFHYASVTAKMEYKQFNIIDQNKSLYHFLSITNIKFKIKAYNFWDLINEPLDCT